MKSLKGRLLIATPRLVDPNFARSVLLMLEHNDEGALGVVLNRPTDTTVGALAERILKEPCDWDKVVRLGGPVPGPLMVIHAEPDAADQAILQGVFTTVDAAKIQDLIRRRVEPSLILGNYAGWGAGQLESEFETDSWLTCETDADEVFALDDADSWERLVRRVSARTLAEMTHLRDLPNDPLVN